jgi:hypothetical protein
MAPAAARDDRRNPVDGAPSACCLAHDGGELGPRCVVQRGEEPRAFHELVRHVLLAGEAGVLGEAEGHVLVHCSAVLGVAFFPEGGIPALPRIFKPDLLGIEAFRVKLLTNPRQHLFVLFVLRILHDLQK